MGILPIGGLVIKFTPVFFVGLVDVFIQKETKRSTQFSLRTVAHFSKRQQLLKHVLNAPGEWQICVLLTSTCGSSCSKLLSVAWVGAWWCSG